MDGRARRAIVVAVLLLLAVAAGLAVDELTANYPDEATLTFVDANGTERGAVDVRVADSTREQFIGLSLTDSLDDDEGMLFVHDDAGPHTYVMRGMSFPIDIVFVDAEGRITEIHHAEVEDRPYTPYRGNGTRIVELPYRWTDRQGVDVGQRVRIQWGA